MPQSIETVKKAGSGGQSAERSLGCNGSWWSLSSTDISNLNTGLLVPLVSLKTKNTQCQQRPEQARPQIETMMFSTKGDGAKKEKQWQLWTPGPYLQGYMVHSFTWSPPPPNPTPLTLILYSPQTPHHTVLKSSWWRLFCPPAPRQPHQRRAECKCECPKNKTKLKNKEVPEGTGDINGSIPKREGERAVMYRRKKQSNVAVPCQTLIIIYYRKVWIGPLLGKWHFTLYEPIMTFLLSWIIKAH